MKRRVRLADVAEAAGVSQGTASNVFAKPDLVRPEVRERVEEVARTLGYHGPDPKGRLLRAGRVNAIGVVVMGDLSYFFSDPFSRAFMMGVAEVCDAQGAGIALVSAVSRDSADWGIDSALVDGFIVQCQEDADRLIELARRRRLPFVTVDVDAGPDAGSIVSDNRGGARQAAEHLLALGHRHFAVLSLEMASDGRTGVADRARRATTRYSATRDRLAGYGEALTAAGVDFDSVPVVEAENDAEGGALGAATLLEAAPLATAVLAMSDVLAIAMIGEAQRRGISVPRDLSVVGYDDVPEAARSDPPLTTIAQAVREKGRRAARMILDPALSKRETLPVKLVVRRSTGPAPQPR
jgi:DNA-binding LacI/PurR family transcriptional regulator